MRLYLLLLFALLQLLHNCWCNQEEEKSAAENPKNSIQKNKPNAIMEDSRKRDFLDKEKKRNLKGIDKISKNFVVYTSQEDLLKQMELDELNLKATEMSNSFPGNKKILSDFELHIFAKGYIKLTALAYLIKEHLNLTLDINLLKIAEDYRRELNLYFNNTNKQQVKCEIEREFYILYLIDSVNNIFCKQTKSLLNEMLSFGGKKVTTRHRRKLSEEKRKIDIDEKQRNLKYICNRVQICRRYPAYSDHLVKIFNETLKLSVDKFKTFVNVLQEIVELKPDFFKSIMDDDIAHKVASKLSSLEDDILEGQKLIVSIGQIVTNRNKIFRNGNGEIKIRLKAMRILIDIFNKAFEGLKEVVIEKERKQVIRAIKVWGIDGNNEIETILFDYFSNIINVLRQPLRIPGFKEEIKALIELMTTGTSKYVIMVDENLFIKGSRFVRG